MLKVFFGSDTINIRKEVFATANKLENEGATITVIDSESFSEGIIIDCVGVTSLFGGEEVFIIDTPSSNKIFLEEVLNNLDAIKESGNKFFLIENSLLAPEKKKYAKYADDLVEIKKEKEDRFNTFALAEALAKKDKRHLWLLLQEARQVNVSDEEIIGILWWQLKSLRLASLTDTAAESGMKDFPYNKAKRSLVNFKMGEIDKLSLSLLTVYHEGHAGLRDLDVSLEKWILTI